MEKKNKNILLKVSLSVIVLAVAVTIMVGLFSTPSKYSYTIKNNGNEVQYIAIQEKVLSGICTEYNATCNLVDNSSTNSIYPSLIYQDSLISFNNLNRTFLDKTCSKINSTAWNCENNIVVQEVKL